MSHSDDRRTWTNEIPTLDQVMQWGGLPGISYAYIHPDHYFEASQNGWTKVLSCNNEGEPIDSGVFTLIGPTGESPFYIIQCGEKHSNVSPFEVACDLFVDATLYEATGIPNPERVERVADLPPPGPGKPQTQRAAQAASK